MTRLTLPDVTLLSAFEEAGRGYLFDGQSLSVAEVPTSVVSAANVAKRSGYVEDNDAKSLIRSLAVRWQRCATQSCSNDQDDHIAEAYLVLTSACNLRCRYCFDARRRGEPTRVMTRELARKSLQFLASQADPRRTFRLVLWGGEPLLYSSLFTYCLEQAEAIFANARVPLRIVTTTNGTLISDLLADDLARHRVSVTFSLDGDAMSHDRNRLTANGAGTFEAAMTGVRRLRAAQKRHEHYIVPTARMTVTHQTVRKFADNHEALWNAGLPIVWAKDVDWQADDSELPLVDEDYDELARQYGRVRDIIADRLQESGGAALHYQLRYDLGHLHQRIKNGGCGAGRTTVSVQPNGDIVACYLVEEHVCLGSVAQDPPQFRRREGARAPTVGEHGPCRRCEFKFLCGGGCAAKAVHHGQGFGACWPGQCQFIRTYHTHCLRLYARLSMMTAVRSEVFRTLGIRES